VIEAVRLYWDLRSRGILLALADGRLWFDAPAGLVTPPVRESILPLKAELVRLLTESCPCSTCAATGDDDPMPRLYCASGLDTDPTWDAVRREFDALDEADERAAIQAMEGP
jgi:hypothetical protein